MTRRRAGIVSLDFAEIHDAVRAGQVDFILTNPALYAELEKLHGIRRIITLINQNVPGQPAMLMGGVILTRANRTDIDRLAALRGRSFMAVDPLSFGGWHMAWRELRKYRIEPERDFSSLSMPAPFALTPWSGWPPAAPSGLSRSRCSITGRRLASPSC